MFSGRLALVTGGNFGIGRGIAHKFAQEGASIAIVARNEARAKAVVGEIESLGAHAAFFKTDVSCEEDVVKMISAVYGHFERIDFVINNAGVGSQHCGNTEVTPPGKRWEVLRGACLDSTYWVTSHSLPHLAKQRGSAVINISSTATLHGNWQVVVTCLNRPEAYICALLGCAYLVCAHAAGLTTDDGRCARRGLYGAAKAGVEGITRSFAAEVAPYGIRVNGISPGWIETSPEETAAAMGGDGRDWSLPPSLFNRMGTPAEIANTAAFLASPAASFITGQTITVDGGMSIIDYPSMPSLQSVGHRVFSHSINAERLDGSKGGTPSDDLI